MRPRHLAIVVLLAICLSTPCAVQAGGGPENVFLVINGRSWASQTIANYYTQLRKIPASNVYRFDWVGSEETTAEVFREKILKKILEEINRRKIGHQIDYVIYSSDFPYAIDVSKDLPPKTKFATASITSLTYLVQPTLSAPNILHGMNTNWYYRPFNGAQLTKQTRGFSSRYIFDRSGEVIKEKEKGQRYLLSTMLGYTSGRGNSVDEVLNYLRKSASADGSQPRGTVYFVKNGDVRSRTRERAFAPTAAELKKLGVKAEIVDGVLPVQKDDVIGAVIGKATFSWPKSGSTMLPGAICENLTSYGGIMRYGAGQTPLTEFTRHGAAGSSGTVVEPYAIQAKFPHPMIHVHYARGCSLAEAFYQSVNGPYQLLIVGDALCRPWARIPIVSVDGVKAGEEVQGVVTLRPGAKFSGETEAAHFRIFVNGQLRKEIPPGETYEFDTTTVPDGHLEFRIVATDDTPIETQGRIIVPVKVNNNGRKIQCTTGPRGRVPFGSQLAVNVTSPGSSTILVYQNRRLLGRIGGAKGILKVDSSQLGFGPTTIQAIGIGSPEKNDHVAAKPLPIEVVIPRPFAPITPLSGSGKTAGLRLTKADKSVATITTTSKKNWLAAAGVKSGESFTLDGLHEAKKTSIVGFQAYYMGTLEIYVNGVQVFRARNEDRQKHYIPVFLEKGWHRIRLAGEFTSVDFSALTFGNKGAPPIGKTQFVH